MLWVAIFVTILVVVNALHDMMRRYIRDKPLGSKSVHDLVFKVPISGISISVEIFQGKQLSCQELVTEKISSKKTEKL
jgi:hypothetical protein